MKSSVRYISRDKLRELLKDPLFVAYAPQGKTIGGILNGQMYWLKKGAE